MATIYLSLSTKRNAVLNVHEIMVRFSHGRINQRTKSGIFIQLEYWDAENQKIIIPRFRVMAQAQRDVLDDLMMKQRQIDDLKSSIMTAFVSLDTTPNKGWLDSVAHPARKETSSFFSTWDDFISKRHVSEQRIAMFRVVRNMLWRFEQVAKVKNPHFELSLDKLTASILNDFEMFLRNEYQYVEKYPQLYKDIADKDLPKARGDNTIADRIAIFRTFIIWAIKNDLTTNDPFKRFEIKPPVYGTPIYISLVERNKLFETNMSTTALNVVRDIFVFQCLIGCRVGDLVRMTKSNIVGDAIEYIPRKTKDGRPVTVRVPLNKLAKRILARYDDDNRNALLPFISVQRYNDNIKECFKQAGLTRIVTVLDPLTREYTQRPICEVASSHMARRTFVGNLYKQVKDPNLVGALSGHKEGSKAFARYRDIDEEMKTELVKLLE
ncbi:MAG: site-specific integrase [Alistipes sp.]|nr:site-specific integrase [Lachnospiraceae bacterium]MCM1250239.1 site-specific integrase [Alistipes sp.]MCM1301885.1 site-specific integrase [Bacteroides cellulosilyticus]